VPRPEACRSTLLPVARLFGRDLPPYRVVCGIQQTHEATVPIIGLALSFLLSKALFLKFPQLLSSVSALCRFASRHNLRLLPSGVNLHPVTTFECCLRVSFARLSSHRLFVRVREGLRPHEQTTILISCRSTSSSSSPRCASFI
jgi:hypothetical protein